MNSTIQNLKEELEAKMAARKAELEEKMAVKRLENEIKLIESPLFEKRSIEATNLNTINQIIQLTTEDFGDEFVVRPYFGFNTTVDRLITLVRSTLFAKTEIKEQLLVTTGWSTSLLEDLMDALGATAYYSPKHNVVVPEKLTDVEALCQYLEEAGQILGLVDLNLQKVRQSVVDDMFERARLKAEDLYTNSQEFIDDDAAAYEV